MKKTTPKYVTDATFKKELNRLDGTMRRLALSSVQYEADIKEIKATMMTRVDGQRISEQLLAFASRYEEAERASRIHLNQLMDFRPQIDNHEKRLGALENQARINE